MKNRNSRGDGKGGSHTKNRFFTAFWEKSRTECVKMGLAHEKTSYLQKKANLFEIGSNDYEIGVTALEKLVARIEGGKEPVQLKIPVTFAFSETTGRAE